MSDRKSKSKKDSMQALANMGANMTAMLSGGSPMPDLQSDNAEEMETSSEQEGGTEKVPSLPVEVNINIEKTQGNAIYSSLCGIQSTLDNFQLDVKQEPLRQVVYEAIKDAVEQHLKAKDEAQLEKEQKLRDEGKPGTTLEAYQETVNGYTNTLQQVSNNNKIIKKQYNNIVNCLCELLGRVNLFPFEKPKFKDDNGHILLNSLYLYPWYCFKCFYSSKHVRGFYKFIAWSIWLITLGLLFFIARDNAVLQKQMIINRYVHAYFSNNADVTMELEGIDLMFSDQDIKPMPIKDYREYMKERKKKSK